MDKKAETKADKPAKTAEAQEQRVVYIQYHGVEVTTKELVYRAKDTFDREHHQALINELELYIKPEEGVAYYVINGEFTGKVEL